MRFSFFKQWSVLFFSAYSLLSSHAIAANSTLCFDFKISANSSTGDVLPSTETWCYQQQTTAGSPTLLIYEVDSENQLLDRSVFITYDATGKRIAQMSFSFLRNGKTQVSALKDPDLNPLPVPLQFSEATKLGKPRALKTAPSQNKLETKVIQHFSVQQTVETETVVPGVFSAAIPTQRFPFNGFWWSQEGLTTAAGANSPLGLFDEHERIRTGRDPLSRRWEAANHAGTVGVWGGHCNGWAASSVLYSEPTKTLYDSSQQKVITPYAQKGMLAESSYCVSTAFYGHRYQGPKDDIRDIYPDLFHKVLSYYIRDLQIPVEMDYSRDEEVDNHIITAYHFNIVKTAVHQLHIDADLTVAKYDVEQRDSLGPADTYHRYYSYTLTVNDQNQILSGKWDDSSDNPDFMWVALGAANHCGGANPAIPAANVLNILKALPEATARAIPLNQKVSAVIAPQDQVPVTSFLIASGDHLKLKFTVQQVSVQAASSKNQLMLIVSGDSRYPVSGGTEESMFIPIVPGTTVANLDRLVSIHSAAIVNQSQIATYSINAAFSELDYVGK